MLEVETLHSLPLHPPIMHLKVGDLLYWTRRKENAYPNYANDFGIVIEISSDENDDAESKMYSIWWIQEGFASIFADEIEAWNLEIL
jgi:hypothetical protein